MLFDYILKLNVNYKIQCRKKQVKWNKIVHKHTFIDFVYTLDIKYFGYLWMLMYINPMKQLTNLK